ncbi:MAG: CoA transferase [Chloroflexi bacterium]|nr:CoA transferase [Chloroflexota bacterium]
MAGPLEGVRVVEMGFWVAGPSAAAILCDWGADVIKIEPPSGDPFRGLFASAMGVPISINPPFELDNRGKRSIALNLELEEARDIARALIDKADVFVSNVRPRVLDEFGFSYEALSAGNPGLVYCQITGYGPDTDDRNRPAYDIGAFWSRAGVAAMLVPRGAPLPHQRGGMGDHMAGSNAAGAICAALLARQRTGRGQRLAVSLLRVGAYMMGWDIMLASRLNTDVVPYDREHAVNPIINCFQAGDGRWFWLLLLQADRHWPDLCRAVGRPDLQEDERFANIMNRRLNAPALVGELDKAFAEKSLDEWGEVFDREDVWWAPVNTVNDVTADPLAEQAGVFVDVPGPDEQPVRMVATPADFYGTPWQARGPVPELGQHTEEVLLELGYEWEQIVALKERGVIP